MQAGSSVYPLSGNADHTGQLLGGVRGGAVYRRRQFSLRVHFHEHVEAGRAFFVLERRDDVKHQWQFYPSSSDGGMDLTDPVTACKECGAEYNEENSTEECCAVVNQENYGADGGGGW